MTKSVRERNQELVQSELRLQELLARVFRGATEADREDFLREFAAFCRAFDREAVAIDPALRDIYQGRRQAFFWLADHLQLDLATCYPRYLKPAERG